MKQVKVKRNTDLKTDSLTDRQTDRPTDREENHNITLSELIVRGIIAMGALFLFLGSGPDRGQSPVGWGEILFILTIVQLFVRLYVRSPSG